jgi:hypothetical protein
MGGLGSVAGPLVGAAYVGMLQVLGTRDTVARFLQGLGGLLLLMFVPGGLAKLGYDVRDAMLRRVAKRHRIPVPSLVADRRAGDDDGRARLAVKTRPGGGTAFVPRRYEPAEQWALGLGGALLGPGEVAPARPKRGSESGIGRSPGAMADTGATNG